MQLANDRYAQQRILENLKTAEDVCFSASRCFSQNLTEQELMVKTYSEAMKKYGFFRWEGCIGSGYRAADPNVKPSDKMILDSDMVIFDFFPNINGYYCDITRTFFGKNADKKLKEMYAELCEVLETVSATIKPGLCAGEVHAQLQDSVATISKDFFYKHHSGHGIGIFQAEKPFIKQGSTDILKENQIIALEPGIYFPGRGGMRIENCYFIEKNGCRKLNTLENII